MGVMKKQLTLGADDVLARSLGKMLEKLFHPTLNLLGTVPPLFFFNSEMKAHYVKQVKTVLQTEEIA